MESPSVLKFRNCQLVDSQEVEEMCFSTTIKDVPRYELTVNSSQVVKQLVCRTGFLSNIDHSLNIIFYNAPSGLQIGFQLTVSPNSVLTPSDIYVGMVRIQIREQDRRVSSPYWEWETVVQTGSRGRISTRYGDKNYNVITMAHLDIYVVQKKKPEGVPPIGSPYGAGNVMLTKNMSRFFLSQEFSDASVECGDGTIIPVHRLVLTGGSEYFDRMFAAGMKEATSSVIRIEEFSSECVKEILRFIYTGKPATINVELCWAADKYGLDELKILCETHLADAQGAVTVENALEVYEISLLQKNRILQERAKKVISSNKKEFLDDAATAAFRELAAKYPEALLDIFQM